MGWVSIMNLGDEKSYEETWHEMQRIPGVGPSIAKDIIDLGYSRIIELADADPMDMYELLKEIRGHYIDRCVLYVFRCAVYYARVDDPDPELLKWWNWKDRKVTPKEW